MTRRDLARIAAAGSAALFPKGKAQAAGKYAGPLDGLEDKVDPLAFDPVIFTQKLYETAPLRLTFRATSRKKAEAWQRQLRSKLTELLGGFPDQRSPLSPQTLETREFPAYRREKFVFQSRPGLYVLGYLLTPLKRARPHPVMVCVPGHGRGVDDIVGIDDQGRDRVNKDGYQHDFAIQVIEHGMAAVASNR